MNTITIELCREDRARLDRILDALLLTAAAPKAQALVQQAEKAQETPETEKAEPVEEVPPEPEKAEPAPVCEAPAVTSADVQAKVLHLVSPKVGKKKEAREIIKQYAERVSLIPEDKLAEVMDKLATLEGGTE